MGPFDHTVGRSGGVDSIQQRSVDYRGRTKRYFLRNTWPDLTDDEHLVVMRASDFGTLVESTRGQIVYEISPVACLTAEDFRRHWYWWPRWVNRLNDWIFGR